MELRKRTMKTTEILTRHLRDDRPVWTICNLPKGFHDPLVASGVLAWCGVLDEIDCDCQDCDFMPKPYIRDESAEVQQWAYTCEMTGEVINVDLDRISYWEYDADRFAEIVNERLECEGVTKVGDGDMWRLGHSRISETQGREIVVKTRFKESDVESVPKLLGNQNSILLVGSLECEVADDQFRRRIFTFDQVVRFADDGEVSFVLDEFLNRFAETVVPKQRGKRADTLAREKEIAEYLKRRFFEIMRIKEWSERDNAIRESKNISAVGKALKPTIAKSTMSRYLNVDWKMGDSETIPQFWFNVVTMADYFDVFSKLVESKPYPMESYDAFTLYGKLYKEFAVLVQSKKK